MANEKTYSSIIDSFLDDREPDWEDTGLKDAQKSGDEVAGWAHEYVDSGFLDDEAGDSHHTPVPPTSRSATLLNRLDEKENALPRIGMSPRRTTSGVHSDDYCNSRGDDESLFEEVTMSLDRARSEATSKDEHGREGVANRNRSDEEAVAYVKRLLNQGTPPARVAAQLEKLAEIELLNKKDNMGMNYLNQNQGLLGMAYLEPNAYMDEHSPTYEREKVGAEGKVFCPKCNKDVKPERRHSIDYCPQCSRNLGQMPKSGGRKAADNWQPVTGHPFYAECTGCRRKKIFGEQGGGWANLEGEAFKAYLCDECMAKRRGAGPGEPKTSADCVRQHNAWKAAGIAPRAASVKKVPACEGCAFFRNKACNLYHLPVVANAEELRAVVNRLTAGVPAASKRAALVALANREPQRVEQVRMVGRTVQKVSAKTVEQAREEHHEASSGFSADTVEAMHKRGVALEEIYRRGSLKVGSVQAGSAVKQFVASLKDKGTKVRLSQIDCRLLKQKLGVSNAIVGAIKCADCVYRQDMHCGLTGGTLLSFPGMEQTGRKTASAPPTDAAALMREYDLVGKPRAEDIELNKDKEDAVTEWKNPRLDDTSF